MKSRERLEKLRSDPDANIIFTRQTYQLKDGVSLGLDRDKYYLYINASDEFFARAEAKLKKSAPSAARAQPDTERQIIETLDNERKRSEQGLGSIFG